MSVSLAIPFSSHATAPAHLYTLSLHDALPISRAARRPPPHSHPAGLRPRLGPDGPRGTAVTRRVTLTLAVLIAACGRPRSRSEEHTSELQSLTNLVCRLLLEKKKKQQQTERRP